MSADMVTTTTYILDSAPLGKRATYTAANSLIFGLMAFLGSLVGGAFTDCLLTSMNKEQAIFTGLMVSAGLRIITSAGFLFIKETRSMKK